MKTAIMVFLWATACLTVMSGCFENGLGGRYTATSMLRIQREEPFIVTRPIQRDSDAQFAAYKETQQQLLKSRFVLLAALRKSEVAKLPTVQAEQKNGDVVRWLENLIRIDFPGNAEIMSVSVSCRDPHEAVVLNRAVTGAYLSEIVNTDRDVRRQRLSELDRACTERETELRDKKIDLDKLMKELANGHDKNKTFPLPIDIEMRRADIKGLEQVLNEIRMERERMRIELRATPRVILLQRADEPESKD